MLYKVFQEYLETWITQTHEEGGYVPSHVEKDFRKYLECGLLCYGFARTRCTCGHEFLVAFSCEGHGICPSCNVRRMVEIAAHLLDYVFPKVPVWQWVLSLANGAIEVQNLEHKDGTNKTEAGKETKRPPDRYLWAVLLARIYNLFPLLCPQCGSEMCVIAVIQDKPVINKILESVGEATKPPSLSPHEDHRVGMTITRISRIYLLMRMNNLFLNLSLIKVLLGENEQ